MGERLSNGSGNCQTADGSSWKKLATWQQIAHQRDSDVLDPVLDWRCLGVANC